MAEIEKSAVTSRAPAGLGIKRKQLIAAVRKQPPEAARKYILRAAFQALTSPWRATWNVCGG
ncbi:hypothetical protein [Methylobacterium radiotolerans]|uniref:hypothetical protein n=1 Tax=Methylobacterium radiotolerans TaxID=31998 RepID=UPI0038D1E17F